MHVTLALSALLTAAQPAAAAPSQPEPGIEQSDVAYEELAGGRSAQAIAALEARLREDPRDPATLINLGTAYARLGDRDRAAQAFRMALASDVRYRLELADGTWADSRTIARRGLERLGEGPALAALDD